MIRIAAGEPLIYSKEKLVVVSANGPPIARDWRALFCRLGREVFRNSDLVPVYVWGLSKGHLPTLPVFRCVLLVDSCSWVWSAQP